MPVESASFISQLNPSYPDGSNPKSEGDDHIRTTKAAVQGSFPNLGAAAVTLTAAELNTVTARALKAGDSYTGTHDFTGGNPLVPTATAGDSTTKAASTAFVQAAIAGVNAQSALVVSVNSAAAISVAAGQNVVCTNAGAVTLTLPASPTVGDTLAVTVGNGRIDNVLARNGQNIMGLAEDMTIDNANVTVAMRYVSASLGWRIF